jgi:hypothetical protein
LALPLFNLKIWAIYSGLWLEDGQNNMQHIADKSYQVGSESAAKKRKEDNG